MKRAVATGPRQRPRGRDGVIDVTVVLLDGGYASTAIGPIEVFHSAGMLWDVLHGAAAQPRFRVQIASIDGRGVTSHYGLKLVPSLALHDIERTDIIVIPTSGFDVQEHIARRTPLLRWLRDWHARGATIAGICTGVTFLAESGLLDGRRATTHWAVADLMRQRYPKVRWTPEALVTEDQRMLCAGGVYSAIDISLYLVEKFSGHEIALQCAKSLLLSMPRSRQSGYAVAALSRPHTDDKIKQAEDYLQAHFDRDVSIETLAAQVGMGARNFIRRFKAATGRLPGAYGQMLRVMAAREMLERSAASIQHVASAVGYDDVAFFRDLFKRHTGMTPAEYRTHFAQLTVERGELAAE